MCCLLKQLRLLHTCFPWMWWDCTGDFGAFCSNLQEVQSAISKSWIVNGGIGIIAMHWPSVSQICLIIFKSEHACHAICCIVSISSMLSCMRFDIIMDKKKGTADGCSMRYNTRSEYLVCIPLGYQSAVPL